MLCTTIDTFTFIFMSLVYFAVSAASQDVITIPLNNTITYDNREIYGGFRSLKGVSNLQIKFTEVNTSLHFIVFQAHSQFHSISLFTSDGGNITQITSTNVGLVSFTGNLDTFYLVNNVENVTLRVYLSVHGYTKTDPIPGGCNMEFAIPISPFLHVQTFSDYIYVDTAPPSIDADCSDDKQLSLSFTFYMMYLPELNFYADVYFDGIRKMMSLKNIEKYGHVIPQNSMPHVRRMLSAYPGIGAVYVVVARRIVDMQESYSVYVPSYSYGCPTVSEEGCEMDDDTLVQILCPVLLFVGAFICFFGHRFFKTEMFLAGLFSGVIIAYVLIALIAVVDKPAVLAGATLSGIFFGAIWWLFWWLFGIPVLSVLLPILNLGFLLAAVFYYRLPGNLIYLEADFNFWSPFILIMILTALALISVTYAANILCCAILGAYATVLSIDYYMGSNLKYIVINTLRRAVVPHFNLAILSPPFQWRELFGTLVWVLLATLGFLFQHWHNRGRPPFPPPPRTVRLSMPEPVMYGAVNEYMRRQGQNPNSPPVGSRVYTVRSALLS